VHHLDPDVFGLRMQRKDSEEVCGFQPIYMRQNISRTVWDIASPLTGSYEIEAVGLLANLSFPEPSYRDPVCGTRPRGEETPVDTLSGSGRLEPAASAHWNSKVEGVVCVESGLGLQYDARGPLTKRNESH
jgi:hypothetical protein